MNKVLLIGRLVKDPELKYVGSSQSSLAEFTLAIERNYKSQNGIRKTDFLKIEAWDKKGELCNKYLKKGSLVSIEGNIITDKYKTESGENRSITKIRLQEIKFLDHKRDLNESDNKKSIFEADEIFNEHEISVDIAKEDIPF